MTSGQALGSVPGIRANLRVHGYPVWIGGGALGAVLLLVVGWFLLIQPQLATADRLREQTATAQDGIASLKQKLAEARLQSQDLDGYRARLTKARAALPNTAALTTFLVDVEAAAVRAGVEFRGMIVGTPAQVTGANAQLYALPISLTAAGSAAKLDGFLNDLQRVQPRAVLISTANLTPDASSVSLAGAATLLLGMRAYVDPPASSVTPTPAASSTN